MDKLSLEARIEAELISYAGKMCVYVNDFKGNTIEIGADEKFETASCIKSFILADLFSQVENGTKDLYEKLKYTKKNYIIYFYLIFPFKAINSSNIILLTFPP